MGPINEGVKLTDFPQVIQRALAEPKSIRNWALANAAGITFADDPEADPIFATLSGPERVRLGRCIANAALTAINALEFALSTPTMKEDERG